MWDYPQPHPKKSPHERLIMQQDPHTYYRIRGYLVLVHTLISSLI